jgi:hypothetical protein
VKLAARCIRSLRALPARIGAGLDSLENLLDPPPVAEPERVETVPSWLQLRLAADDAQRARNLELLARLLEVHADNEARLAQLDTEMLERGIAFN